MVQNFIESRRFSHSYFHREFDASEVKQSYFAPNNHYSSHCAVTLILSSSVQSSVKLTDLLLSNKIVRPHLDNFVQFLPNIADVIQFQRSEYAKWFRYVQYATFKERFLLAT